MLSNATTKRDGEGFISWNEGGSPDRRGDAPQAAGWVLVVDGDEDHRDLMVETLEDAGYQARGVASVAGAVEAIHAAPFLVLADLQMPRMDGSGFLAVLRAERGVRIPPVVFLSSALPSNIQKGPAPVLSKPVDIDQLLDVVYRHSSAVRPESLAAADG